MTEIQVACVDAGRWIGSGHFDIDTGLGPQGLIYADQRLVTVSVEWDEFLLRTESGRQGPGRLW